MELTFRDWVELTGVVILPILGFIITIILGGLKSRLRELQTADEGLVKKIEALEREQASWHADLPEKYARRDDLERTFQQLNQAILRMDEKLDRVLHSKL